MSNCSQDLLLRITDMEGGVCVAKEAETALDYLSDRREFWSQQKPDYQAAGKHRASLENKKTLKAAVLRQKSGLRGDLMGTLRKFDAN